MISKRAMVIGLTTATLVGGLAIAGSAGAQDVVSENSMTSQLAARFGLNESEVKEFFSEKREEHRAEKQQRAEEALSRAVADGVITQEQKQALMDRKAQMMADREEGDREAYLQMSPEERRSAHEEKRAAFEDWAEEQAIDLEALSEYRGENGGKRFGRSHGFGK